MLQTLGQLNLEQASRISLANDVMTIQPIHNNSRSFNSLEDEHQLRMSGIDTSEFHYEDIQDNDLDENSMAHQIHTNPIMDTLFVKDANMSIARIDNNLIIEEISRSEDNIMDQA